MSKELGFDTVEFNASDTRSKNLIQQQITELTCTNSLSGFVNGIDIIVYNNFISVVEK